MRDVQEHLKRLAGACPGGDASARLRLLAHLFAYATVAVDRPAAGRWQACRVQVPQGWEDLPAYLAAVGEQPRHAWFKGWLGALLALDALHGEAHGRGGPGRPARVELDGVRWADGRPVAGRVDVWVRPESALRALRERRDAGGGPQRFDYAPARRLRHLSMAWERDGGPILAPVPLAGLPPELVVEPGRRLREGGSFRVALCPLSGPFWPRFRALPDEAAFAVDELPMHGPADLADHLRALLADAAAAQVDLVVLPELTVDAAGLDALRAALPSPGPWPLAVVAGSFHVPAEDGTRNLAPVLDEVGGQVWAHAKRGFFRVRAGHARAMGDATGRPGLFVGPLSADLRDDDELAEAIVPGSSLQVLDTTAGRVALLVCADLVDHAAELDRAVAEAGVDLLVVVAMSPRLRPFLTTTETLRRGGCAVLFVNAGCILPWTRAPDDVAAFVGLPLRRARLPVCLRWRPGAGLEDCGDGVDQEDATPLLPDGDALALLPEGRGLVVDLGAWAREPLGSGSRPVRARTR